MIKDGIEMVRDGLSMAIVEAQKEERRIIMEMIDIHIQSHKDTEEKMVNDLDDDNKVKLSRIISKVGIHTLEVLKDSLTKFYSDD